MPWPAMRRVVRRKASPPLPGLVGRPRVLFCLFIWPVDPSYWQPLLNAIRTRPDLDFMIIINPNSGPGEWEPPHEHHLAAVPLLRGAAAAGQIVELVGYVTTRWGERAPHLVQRDVDRYAAWPASSGRADMALDGIYFDESSWHEFGARYYREMAEYARSKEWGQWRADAAVPSSHAARNGLVVLNPGCWVHQDYYAFSDLIIVHEQTLQKFDLGRLQNLPMPFRRVPRHKFGVLLHDGPPPADEAARQGDRSPGFHLANPAHLAFSPDTPFTTRGVTQLCLQRLGLGAYFLTSLSLAQTDIYASFGSNFDEWIACFADSLRAMRHAAR